jgi:glycerol-3-phosphate acyltransferase PlsY
VDILKAGSGNPGATNVKRTCGKFAGNLVFVLDLLKGFIAAFWPWVFSATLAPEEAESMKQAVAVAQLCGFAGALLGHCFSIFLKFKGGKGVSTTFGGLLGAMPIAVLVGVVVWLAVYFPTRIVAIASMVFGLSLPLTSMVLAKFFPQLGYTGVQVGFCLVVAIFIIIMHRSNIARLMRGEENSFSKK